MKVDSKLFSAIPLGCYIYEVDNEYERHMVNLTRKRCTCSVEDLTGIPCKHGVQEFVRIWKDLRIMCMHALEKMPIWLHIRR